MSKDWLNISTKQLSLEFINHIESHYYRSYLSGSQKFEKVYNRFFNLSILLSFLISLLSIIQSKMSIDLSIIITILPLVSSFLLMISAQKGWKEKQEIRELARIKCKHLLNEARMRYSICKSDDEYSKLYRWLNSEIEKIQLDQATKYFSAHNKSKVD